MSAFEQDRRVSKIRPHVYRASLGAVCSCTFQFGEHDTRWSSDFDVLFLLFFCIAKDLVGVASATTSAGMVGRPTRPGTAWDISSLIWTLGQRVLRFAAWEFSCFKHEFSLDKSGLSSYHQFDHLKGTDVQLACYLFKLCCHLVRLGASLGLNRFAQCPAALFRVPFIAGLANGNLPIRLGSLVRDLSHTPKPEYQKPSDSPTRGFSRESPT